MSVKRVVKDRFYIADSRRVKLDSWGNSCPAGRILRVITGWRGQDIGRSTGLIRHDIVSEYKPSPKDRFRLLNGHRGLPEIVDWTTAKTWLAEMRYSEVELIR
jgi:hypothetical protein